MKIGRIEEADALTVICLGLSGYIAFWIYYWSLLSGEIFSMAYLIGAAALWGRRKTTGIRLIGPSGVLLCLVGILYISLLNLHGPSRLDASFTQSYFFFEPKSFDNLIPLWFEQAIIIPHAPRVGFGDWLFSDRPPLRTGLSLYVFPISKILGVELVYEAVGIFSQLLFLVGARMLLGTCGSNKKKATYIVLVLVTTGCIYFNTVYTWPKLLAACYSLIALAVVVKLWRTHRITMADGLMFGVSVSLAVLSHSGEFPTLTVIIAWAIICCYRIKGRAWRTAGLAALVAAAVYVPWFFYQKFVNPPGNRLIKWHLAGREPVDRLGVAEAITGAYRSMSLRDWLDTRKNHFETTITNPDLDNDIVREWEGLAHAKSGSELSLTFQKQPYYLTLATIPISWRSLAALIRYDQVEQYFRALGILNIVWPLLLLQASLRRIICRHDKVAVVTFIVFVTSLVFWSMLEFLKHAFILRNICYSTLVFTILFTGSVLHEAGKYLRVGVFVLNVLAAFLIWIWLLPTDYVGRNSISILGIRSGRR